MLKTNYSTDFQSYKPTSQPKISHISLIFHNSILKAGLFFVKEKQRSFYASSESERFYPE
jgi:hypothetical protein